MIKNMVLIAGLAVMVAGAVAANLLAQAPVGGGKPAFKAGVINIDAVFAKYEKAKVYKKELDDMIAPFKSEAEKLKKQITDIQDYLKHPKSDPSKKDQYERAVLEYRRKLEDLDRDVRKLIGKKQEDQLVVLYKEVVSATQLAATSNGVTMVFGYGEPFENVGKEDMYSFANISRKMQGMGMGIVPIWFSDNVDVTDVVVQTLNQRYRSTGGLPVGGGKN